MTLSKAYDSLIKIQKEEMRRLKRSSLSNISAYESRKLCEKLSICAKARESAEIFNKYCSRDYKSCPSKILTN